MIGALGAIDDMTVTQVAALNVLHAANPDLEPRRLYRSALRIGRDHVASTVNTFALAYAGASLPLLLLFPGPGGIDPSARDQMTLTLMTIVMPAA